MRTDRHTSRGYHWLIALVAFFLAACSSVKHVPENEYLLDKVDIEIEGDSEVEKATLVNFLRQQPNHKVLGFARLSLGAYSLSGTDTTRWYNKWLRRIGQPPVIYSADATESSRNQLRQAMINSGYMDATVEVDTFPRPDDKRMAVSFRIDPGEPRRIESIGYQVEDPALREIVMSIVPESELRPGILLNRTALDQERARITRHLQTHGYYDFTRESINFTADTVAGSKLVGLTVNVRNPRQANRRSLNRTLADTLLSATDHHRVYLIRHVNIVVDGEINDPNAREVPDTFDFHGKTFIFTADRYLRPRVVNQMIYLEPGAVYSIRNVERTYEALGRLGIVKYTNIETEPVGSAGNVGLLDVTIHLNRNKKQSLTAELEGTNSEGDLGFGVGLGYKHRDIGRGAEQFSAKVRAAYESLSGNFEGLVNHRYTEYAGEFTLAFPQFKCPFLSRSFRQRVLATTELTASFNYQERPEYTRIIAGGAWKWVWQQRRLTSQRRHTYDLIDINYVRLPRSTIDFLDQIAPSNPLLRYSYEDHFIVRMGYTYYSTTRRAIAAGTTHVEFQPEITTVRAAFESAGNLLNAISHMVGQKKHEGVYKILGIQYAQYLKGEVDFTYTRHFDTRNSLSFHVGSGLIVPYGNSSMVPFEKRFYAGGANGVRGWGVRTLGPGRYDARNSVTDFINQCGDIRLDLSLEFRTKLFWVLEGALFIDAGNIWTIRSYENQPGGLFRLNSFYKELAAAYGLGIRMDFTYFLLRFDLGFKAHNPAMNQEPWPLVHPNLKRDANLHFAVGYPF